MIKTNQYILGILMLFLVGCGSSTTSSTEPLNKSTTYEKTGDSKDILQKTGNSEDIAQKTVNSEDI
jgi:hypothetical protein